MTIYTLKNKHLTLKDLYEDLHQYGQEFVKVVSQEDLDRILTPPEDHYNHLFLPIKVYVDDKAKAKNDPIYMVFVQNGLVHYSNGDVLTHFKLDEPRFFWGFDSEEINGAQVFAEQVRFSDSDDAIQEWTFRYNYDEIFEALFLDGDQDLAGFTGFFKLST